MSAPTLRPGKAGVRPGSTGVRPGSTGVRPGKTGVGPAKVGIAQLRKSLNSAEWSERRRAVLALTGSTPALAWPLLENALGDTSDDVRHAAVLVIGRLGIHEAHDELLKPRLLASPDANLRWAVVQTLGLLADPRDIIPLTRMLHDEDWLVRNEASKVLADALGRLGEPDPAEAGSAIDTLIHLLFLENETLRPLVVRGLCRHGSRALPALREALHEPSPAMLAGAVRVLGLLCDRHSLGDLILLGSHPDRAVRMAVAEALGRLGGPDAARSLLRMMSVRQGDVCDVAERALLELGRDSVAPILEMLQHADCARLRARGIRLLGRLRAPEALPMLRQGMRSSYYRVRQATIEALVAFGPGLVPDLIPLLTVTVPDVTSLIQQTRAEQTVEGRLRLIRVIGDTGNHAAVDFLKEIRATGSDEDGLTLRRSVNQALFQLGCSAWERYCLLAVLGQIATEEHAAHLLPSLQHPSYYVRNRAVRSLARFATPAVAQGLAQTALKDPRFFVRRTALQILGAMEADKTLRYRTAMTSMEDSVSGIRVEASRVLGRLVDARAVPMLIQGLLDEVWSVRESCEIALRNFPAQAAKPLSKLLNEEREFVRLRVVRLLGMLGNKEAITGLKRRLGVEPKGTRVHEAIQRSLNQLAG